MYFIYVTYYNIRFDYYQLFVSQYCLNLGIFQTDGAGRCEFTHD